MDKILLGYMEDFKKYTIEMILNLKNDELNNFEVALEKREQIIAKINNFKFDPTEFKEICEKLNIIDIDNELSKIINEERNKLKQKILQLKKSQNANNAYNSNLNKNVFLSKKV